MTLVSWNPSRGLASMEIDRLDRMFENFVGSTRRWMPAVDVFETQDREYVIKAELPEMKRDDINVTFEDNVLTVSGERKDEGTPDSGTWHRNERYFGAFSRSFTLPATADGTRISAAYKDGVLTIRVPQREDVRPRQITVGE